MNISIKGSHVDLTASFKEYVEEKIGSLSKFTDATEAKVEIDRDQHHHSGLVFHAEVNLIQRGKVIHADVRGSDGYEVIDLLLPKIKEQVLKLKDKKQTLRRQGAREAKENF